MLRLPARVALLLALLVGGGALVASATAGTATTTLVSGNGSVGGADAQVQYYDGSAWVPAQIVPAHPAYSLIPGTAYVAPEQGSAGGGPTTIVSGEPFRIAFTLPAVYASPSLSGGMFADNYADAYVNGTWVGGQPHAGPYANFHGTPTPFSTADASLFHPGVNYLSFELGNLGGPQGLDFSASVDYTPLTSADQCKQGGWQSFAVFENQGDCVSYVATAGKNPPANG